MYAALQTLIAQHKSDGAYTYTTRTKKSVRTRKSMIENDQSRGSNGMGKSYFYAKSNS